MFAPKFLVIAGTLVLLLPKPAKAQAMVEYGMGVGRAGASGAAAGRTGQSTGRVFAQTGRTMNKAGQRANQNSKYPIAPQQEAKAEPRPAPPAPQPELAENPVLDIAELKEGLERKDLLEKFGKPSMKITMMEGPDVVERLLYRATGRDTVVVIVRNGKVASASAMAN